jgi:hypothetical protein
MLKKVLCLLLISCAVPQYTTANNYPLSSESKQFIVNSALAGGIVGGGLGLIAAFEKQSNEKHAKHATTWQKIKSFPWHYVILPAMAGAAGAGLVASFFTTEEYLKSAEQELAALDNNVLLDKALRTNDAQELKKMAFNSQYPSLTTYDRLEVLLARIQKAKEYLFTVIKSGTSPLVSIAQAALERLKAMEQRITDWLIKLKDSSQYFHELKARTEIDFKNQMVQAAQRTAAAAESQARAAQQAAHAAWHQAHHAPAPVYVAPPPVNVYVKK